MRTLYEGRIITRPNIRRMFYEEGFLGHKVKLKVCNNVKCSSFIPLLYHIFHRKLRAAAFITIHEQPFVLPNYCVIGDLPRVAISFPKPVPPLMLRSHQSLTCRAAQYDDRHDECAMNHFRTLCTTS